MPRRTEYDNLRLLMWRYFNRDDLELFWATYFPAFYTNFEGAPLSKASLISKFMKHCKRKHAIDRLHQALQATRPIQYKRIFRHAGAQ